jgi:holo-[acyl-carrier protein] synthase
MIMGTGIDFVAVSRIAHWLDDDALCRRFFNIEELSVIRSRGAEAARSLAARFAAKEAFAKALGTGFAGLTLKDIRVKNEKSGRPLLVLEGSALDAMKRIGATRAHLSLTHEQNLAAAQVILEA